MNSGSLLQLNEYVVMAEHDVAPRVLIHLRDGAVQYPGRGNMQIWPFKNTEKLTLYLKFFNVIAVAIFISVRAKRLPMHMRGPAVNGRFTIFMKGFL